MPARRGFSFSDIHHYLPYFLMLIVFVGGVWLILTSGAHLQPANSITAAPATGPTSPAHILWENFRTSLSILLTQIIVILILAAVFRRLFRSIHQPPVMGEMVAG